MLTLWLLIGLALWFGGAVLYARVAMDDVQDPFTAWLWPFLVFAEVIRWAVTLPHRLARRNER